LRLPALLALVLVLLAPAAAVGQTVYVTDQLVLGLHETPDPESAIVKLVPSGTPLEVLEREGELAQVRTDDGVIGWVDTEYVIEERPAHLALLELEAQNADLRAELELARSERERLQEELAAGGGEGASNPPAGADALRQIEQLAAENQRLREALAQAEAQAAAAPVELAAERHNPVPVGGFVAVLLRLSLWHYVLIGALMLLAFGLGGYLVDWNVRRRHGGFRI